MTKRFQSPVNSEVYFEPWKCKLSGQRHIEFAGLLELIDIRFFLVTDDAIYVVSIPRLSPFRLVDETYLGTLTEHLFHEKIPSRPRSSTWKLWGTPFVKELNFAKLLFFDRPEEERFQYVVLTQNECLEFVSPEPKIEMFKSKKLPQIFRIFCEKELKALEKVT